MLLYLVIKLARNCTLFHFLKKKNWLKTFFTQTQSASVTDIRGRGQLHSAPTLIVGAQRTVFDRWVLVSDDLAGDETSTDGLATLSRTRWCYRLNS
jgi:hypothetical protein